MEKLEDSFSYVALWTSFGKQGKEHTLLLAGCSSFISQSWLLEAKQKLGGAVLLISLSCRCWRFLSELLVVCGNVESCSALVPSRVQMFLVSFGHLSGL